MQAIQKGVLGASAVTTQPGPNELMMNQRTNDPSAPPPGGLPSPSMICPPGLEYLIHLDRFLVKRPVRLNLSDVMSGEGVRRRYVVTSEDDEQIFDVVEISSMHSHCCYGAYRDLEVKVFDRNQREVVNMIRPFTCENCCSICNDQEMHVLANRMTLGRIVQSWSLFKQRFSIVNDKEEVVLKVNGPSFTGLCSSPVFKVKSADELYQIGSIMKRFTGCYVTVEVFEVCFPADLDVRMKAVLLGACILVDIMYYENRR